MTDATNRFGGDWTIEKLEAVTSYCDGYTRALKQAPDPDRLFRLHFIDAFAGTGYVTIKSGTMQGQRVEGSAIRALSVADRPFDKVHLIELSSAKAHELRRAVKDHKNRVSITIGDANEEVVKICSTLTEDDRAVILFDPASMQLNWDTVQMAANTRKCDIWILFPLSAVRRVLARKIRPTKDSSEGRRLTRVLGTEAWYEQYVLVDGPEPAEQASLSAGHAESISIGGEHWESSYGTDWILDLYHESLARVFPEELVLSREMTNSQNSALFALLFGCANSRGAKIANRIAAGAIKKAKREAEQLKRNQQNPQLFG